MKTKTPVMTIMLTKNTTWFGICNDNVMQICLAYTMHIKLSEGHHYNMKELTM